MPAKLLKAAFILDPASQPLIYGPEEQRDIAELVEVVPASQLSEAEIILSGWGAPKMDEAFLARAPKLQAVFYGAGSTRYFTTEAFWERDIVLTSAAAANAVPVADYTVSVILLSLKHFWRYAALTRTGEGWGDHKRPIPGIFRRTVGIISLGMIGRMVQQRLRALDLNVITYDPFANGDSSLEEVFREADVVSLHTPWMRETEGMITGKLLASMKPGATFINTARGAIVNEAELVEVFRQRPDLTAVLDVLWPEPPEKDSPLLTLPNVVVTPHIAGSHGSEIQRLGRYMVEELQRYLAGEPLQWQITRKQAAMLA